MNKPTTRLAVLRMVSLFALALAVTAAAAVLAAFPRASAALAGEPESAPQSENEAAAKAAFLAAYPVFMHPRCMNCHPAGDIPFQGDDNRLHAQNVQRGAAGMGKFALRCTNCHQLTNLPGENMPPGVPNWHMPPPKMKMVFEGKSAGDLCRQFKDPKQNGGHATAAAAVEHLEKDPLVHWGWAPGDGRSIPPLSHAEFVRKMHEWVQNGAACPE